MPAEVFSRGIKILDFSPLYRLLSGVVFWMTMLLVVSVDTFVFRLKVIGRGNLRKVRHRGCFLISNHTLYLDPGVIAHTIMPKRTFFSALQQTFEVPYLGNYIRYLGAFPIPDNYGIRAIFKPVQTALEKGWWIHFFPERDLHYHSQKIEPFYGGVFYLAARFNRPIVPITLVLCPLRVGRAILSRNLFRLKAVIEKPIDPQAFKAPGLKMREVIETMTLHAQQVMMRSIETHGERR